MRLKNISSLTEVGQNPELLVWLHNVTIYEVLFLVYLWTPTITGEPAGKVRRKWSLPSEKKTLCAISSVLWYKCLFYSVFSGGLIALLDISIVFFFFYWYNSDVHSVLHGRVGAFIKHFNRNGAVLVFMFFIVCLVWGITLETFWDKPNVHPCFLE